jgi:hypothetical protein
MGRAWFCRWGWVYRPITMQGWIVVAVAALFCVNVFFVVDHHSHSARDTLYGVFPFCCPNHGSCRLDRVENSFAGQSVASRAHRGDREPLSPAQSQRKVDHPWVRRRTCDAAERRRTEAAVGCANAGVFVRSKNSARNSMSVRSDNFVCFTSARSRSR